MHQAKLPHVTRFFHKTIKNPFLGGDNIQIYADMNAASFFHNGNLIPVLDGIRTVCNDGVLCEDNEIEILLRAIASNAYRITYRLGHDDEVKAMILSIDGPDFTLVSDPLI